MIYILHKTYTKVNRQFAIGLAPRIEISLNEKSATNPLAPKVRHMAYA